MNASSSLRVRVSVFLVACLALFIGWSGAASAAPECFCTVGESLKIDSPKDFDLKNFEDTNQFDRQCLPAVTTAADCKEKSGKVDNKFTHCQLQDTPDLCKAEVAKFDKNLQDYKQLVIQAANGTSVGGSSDNGARPQGLLAKVLPDCVFDTTVEGECKDVNIFIKLAIDLANVLLSIIGGIALIAFVYGGFILILSEGSSERIEKGKGAMVAALIGLAVVFGAYLIVNILSDALGVSSAFRLS